MNHHVERERSCRELRCASRDPRQMSSSSGEKEAETEPTKMSNITVMGTQAADFHGFCHATLNGYERQAINKASLRRKVKRLRK